MELTTEQVLLIIGAKEVEIFVLRQQVAQLQQKCAELQLKPKQDAE